MIFKNFKGLKEYPEFTINEEGISLFNKNLSMRKAFKEITSAIGNYSRAFNPGNPNPNIPFIYIYDHYGLVLKNSQYGNALLGMEFHYYVFKDLNLNFTPIDIFKGTLTLMGKENLHLLTESNTEDYFPEAEIRLGFYNGQLITDDYKIVFRFDDDSKITSINIDFLVNIK